MSKVVGAKDQEPKLTAEKHWQILKPMALKSLENTDNLSSAPDFERREQEDVQRACSVLTELCQLVIVCGKDTAHPEWFSECIEMLGECLKRLAHLHNINRIPGYIFVMQESAVQAILAAHKVGEVAGKTMLSVGKKVR